MADDDTLAASSEHNSVTDDNVHVIITTLMGIVSHPKATHRAITAAARVLAQYRRLDRDAIEADIIERLEAIEEHREAEGDS